MKNDKASTYEKKLFLNSQTPKLRLICSLFWV